LVAGLFGGFLFCFLILISVIFIKKMQAIATQNRHLLLITLILAFLLTIFYSIYTPTPRTESEAHDSLLKFDLESKIKQVNKKKISTICDKADISWL
jgi:apolipoprotein N-acyltransferase